VAKIKVPGGTAPCAAAAGGKWVWVSEYGQPNLLKIDPRTNKVVGKSRVGFGACGLAYGAGSMWVEDTSSSTVSRVSVATGKRRAIKVGATPYDATFAFGSAWTTAFGGGELERIDPATNRVANRWKITAPVGVVGAFGSVWAAGSNGVIRIDPVTHKVLATITVDGGAQWTAASADAVWVTTPTGLVRIDPATNAVVATITLASAPYLGDPDVIDGLVWVPQIRKNSIAVVDPASNTVVQTIPTGAGPFVVTAIAGDAWVPSWHGSDIWRFRPAS
jgi:YVTN family beta-propeller protein